MEHFIGSIFLSPSVAVFEKQFCLSFSSRTVPRLDCIWLMFTIGLAEEPNTTCSSEMLWNHIFIQTFWTFIVGPNPWLGVLLMTILHDQSSSPNLKQTSPSWAEPTSVYLRHPSKKQVNVGLHLVKSPHYKKNIICGLKSISKLQEAALFLSISNRIRLAKQKKTH